MDGFLKFMGANSIYIVLLIVLVIWLGIFLFLNSLDKRMKQIEKEMKGSNLL